MIKKIASIFSIFFLLIISLTSCDSSPKTYTLTYKYSQALNDVVQSYKEGDYIQIVNYDDSFEADYYIEGYYSDSNYSNETSIPWKMPANNVTLYVKVQKYEYTAASSVKLMNGYTSTEVENYCKNNFYERKRDHTMMFNGIVIDTSNIVAMFPDDPTYYFKNEGYYDQNRGNFAYCGITFYFPVAQSFYLWRISNSYEDLSGGISYLFEKQGHVSFKIGSKASDMLAEGVCSKYLLNNGNVQRAYTVKTTYSNLTFDIKNQKVCDLIKATASQTFIYATDYSRAQSDYTQYKKDCDNTMYSNMKSALFQASKNVCEQIDSSRKLLS